MNNSSDRLGRSLPSMAFVAIAALVITTLLALFICFAVYNVAADTPPTLPVFRTLEQLRDRAIVVHARNMTPRRPQFGGAHIGWPAAIGPGDMTRLGQTVDKVAFDLMFALGAGEVTAIQKQ